MHTNSQNTPRAGDIIRLTGTWKWGMVGIGKIAVIGGSAGQDMSEETGSITFNASAFNDGKHVSCSGGPATIGGIPTKDLHYTDKTMMRWFWHWKDGFAGRDRGVYYQIPVRVWEWNGNRE